MDAREATLKALAELAHVAKFVDYAEISLRAGHPEAAQVHLDTLMEHLLNAAGATHVAISPDVKARSASDALAHAMSLIEEP